MIGGWPSWQVPALLELDLHYLAQCPGADAERLLARRDRVQAARTALEDSTEFEGDEPDPSDPADPGDPGPDPAGPDTAVAEPPAHPGHPADAAESP